MMPGFLNVNKHKKKRNIQLKFQINRLNTTNLMGKLFKIGKEKKIFVENIVLY